MKTWNTTSKLRAHSGERPPAHPESRIRIADSRLHRSRPGSYFSALIWLSRFSFALCLIHSIHSCSNLIAISQSPRCSQSLIFRSEFEHLTRNTPPPPKPKSRSFLGAPGSVSLCAAQKSPNLAKAAARSSTGQKQMRELPDPQTCRSSHLEPEATIYTCWVSQTAIFPNQAGLFIGNGCLESSRLMGCFRFQV